MINNKAISKIQIQMLIEELFKDQFDVVVKRKSSQVKKKSKVKEKSQEKEKDLTLLTVFSSLQPPTHHPA